MAATTTGGATKVANLTSWSISITHDKSEVTAMNDDWKSYVRGYMGASMKATGFWADDADMPYDAFDADQTVPCYLYPAETAVGKYWFGQIWPDSIGCDAPSSGSVTFSVDGTFDGAVTRF